MSCAIPQLHPPQQSATFSLLRDSDEPQATLNKCHWRCRVLKGGEEVRTDQRVEQLFDVVNGLLRRSPAAAAASLQVGACNCCSDHTIIK